MATDVRSAAVVGAGVAGLACAVELARAGVLVTLIEKARRPGGRVATRRVEGVAFNHGAQFATARGPGFGALLAGLQAAGQAAPWIAAGADGRRMTFVPGMSALPATMADQATGLGVVLQTERQVAFLHAGEAGWAIRHLSAADIRPGATAVSGGEVLPGQDAVLVALPSSQAASLLATAAHPFADVAVQAVVAPCWTVMARFPAPVAGPDVVQDASGPVSWAAREGSRPGHAADPEAWTLNASAAWSRAHLEDDAEDAGRALVAAFRAATGAPAPDLVLAHRWRHALVETPVGRPCLWDPATRLGACGDWCLGGRVEAAYDSGVALALAVLGRA
jgi:renalase